MITSIGLEGMKGYVVHIEADVRNDREQCTIVGLPDTSMKESKERIISNLYALNIDISLKKITIHLYPSDKRKMGVGYDCAMLLAVLQQLFEKPLTIPPKTCVLGGLSLKGEIVSFHGVVPSIHQAIQLGFEKIIIPPIETETFGLPKTVQLIPLSTVQQLLDYFRGQLSLSIAPPKQVHKQAQFIEEFSSIDFSAIVGHEEAKRALEIAAAGNHHLLLTGPPGCGKSMLAEAFQSIFPDLTEEEVLETYSIYHLAKEQRTLTNRPPYRAPHHSSSAVSLIGGGTFPKPGEISLAHRGILFLDELGEFSRKSLDMLRQPLEKGEVTISRVRQSVTYPAAFTLIAATNPCPCGYAGSNERYCTCSPKQIRAYQLKASGPLLDRFDFILKLSSSGLQNSMKERESSAQIQKRTTQARSIQKKRYRNLWTNGNVPSATLLALASIPEHLLQHLSDICFQKKWSNRTQLKIIRIARTIADLAGSQQIQETMVEEAIYWKEKATLLQEESILNHQ